MHPALNEGERMTKRVLSVLMVGGLVAGALGATTVEATAKKSNKCKAYKPGPEGAEAKTAKVTDKATEKKPVAVTLATTPGAGVGGEDATETAISHVYHNVQVDSKAKSAKLFIRLEMVDYEDQDLYVRLPSGAEVARAAGFNPEPAIYNDDSGGGHTEKGAEVIDGIITADCGGYTIDVAAATGTGSDVTLKYWLAK